MHTRWPSRIVLVISVAASLVAAFLVGGLVKSHESTKFNDSADELRQTIISGINRYLTLLDSVRALAVAKVSMNPAQFHGYVTALDLRKKYRGVTGFGVAVNISAEQESELIDKVRQQGISNFQVWPDSEQDQICPLVIVEPPDEQNMGSIGYDLLAEEESRKAVIRAAQSGQPIATPTIGGGSHMSGSAKKQFSILVPAYRGGELPGFVEERRANLAAIVHCAFQTEEFLKAIIPRARASPSHFEFTTERQ